jgi:hypothetical protein
MLHGVIDSNIANEFIFTASAFLDEGNVISTHFKI